MSVDIPASELQAAADQCVKCAVCLPHCPTYALSPQEAESPRGRITLLQGIVHERLDPTEDIYKHLESCLSCGRCEQVCPAKVPYTRLLDGGRVFMSRRADRNRRPVRRRQRLAAWLLRSGSTLRLLAGVAQLAKRLRLDKALGPSRPARWLNWMAPAVSVSPPPSVPNTTRAVLFAGCLTDAFERDIAASARHVAAALGVTLDPAPEGLCCGALYQHLGDSAQMDALNTANIQALSGDTVPVVALLSGCARGLRDGLNFSSHADAANVAERMIDLFDLLPLPDHPVFETNDAVALYAPCSQSTRQAQRIGEVIRQLSGREPMVLDKAHGCCGAAGDHMFVQPERADRLAKPIVDQIIELNPTHVVTPNLGCAWHLRDNLIRRGANVVVEHPVQWIARHLPSP